MSGGSKYYRMVKEISDLLKKIEEYEKVAYVGWKSITGRKHHMSPWHRKNIWCI